MSCNFIHYLMTYFGGYDCHLSQLSPKSPISVLPITLHRYTLGTLQALAMCHCLLAGCGNQDQQRTHIKKQHLWLVGRAGLSGSRHIPAGCTKIWFPKSKPKQACYTLQ